MGHTYANVLLHVVFSTKDRAPTIRDTFRVRLYEYMAGVARNEFGRALSIGGTADHVHGLLSIGTDRAIGDIMSKWKSLSSGWAHQTIADAKDMAWQTGYGAFSVSQSKVAAVSRYIEEQAEHHKKRTFEEEFVALLKRHGIDFDAAHVWD
jgi:REP element-mobilizing transposase RayT